MIIHEPCPSRQEPGISEAGTWYLWEHCWSGEALIPSRRTGWMADSWKHDYDAAYFITIKPRPRGGIQVSRTLAESDSADWYKHQLD